MLCKKTVFQTLLLVKKETIVQYFKKLSNDNNSENENKKPKVLKFSKFWIFCWENVREKSLRKFFCFFAYLIFNSIQT
jgi:hypothetical protein